MTDETTRIEHYEDGRVLERNLTDGRFVKSELPSDLAADIGRGVSKAEKAESIEILLQEAGFEDTAEAPEALKAVCEEIAKRGSKTISAIVEYRRWLASKETGGTERVKLQSGEVCTRCGRDGKEWFSNLGPEAIDQLVEVFKEVEDEENAGIREAQKEAKERPWVSR